MLLADRYADLAVEQVTPGCPQCGASLRPRVGTDVQAVAPVLESLLGPHRTAYLGRLFTAGELAAAGLATGADPVVAAESLAARFAAKEAVVKVLRPTATEPRPPWTDIEVTREASGEPRLILHAAAATHAARAGLTSWTCSLSHDAGIAVATVVALETLKTDAASTPPGTVRKVDHDHR